MNYLTEQGTLSTVKLKRRLHLAITMSFLPVGYLLALLIGEIVFTPTDKYFMYQKQTLSKVSTVYFIYLGVILANSVYILLTGKLGSA